MGTACRERARRRAHWGLVVLWVLGLLVVSAPRIALAEDASGAAAAAASAGTGAAKTAPPAIDEAGAIALLRSARAADRSGELEVAVARYAAVEERHPIVSDHAALLAARALLSARRFEDATKVLDRYAARGLPSPLESELAGAWGEAARGRGDVAGARSATTRALGATEAASRQAPLLRALAELDEEAGQPEASAAAWLRLWRDFPAQPAARGSGERLEQFGIELGGPLRTGADARVRGDRLFEAGLRESSVDAYDFALARDLEADARSHVIRRRAEALFGLRRYAEARSAFASLGPADATAQVFEARAVARSGDVPGAVAMLVAQAEARPGAAGAEARWYAALLLDGEGETARAEPLFLAVEREASDPALRAGAAWRLGFAAYRAGRFEVARTRFEAMAAAAEDLIAKLQARYWAARAGERAGQGAPEAELASLVQEAPFTYYGWRAREWLARHGAVPKPAAERAPLAAGVPVLGARESARAQILVQADLGSDAIDEIDRLAGRIAGVEDTLRVADLYREAEAYDRAQGLVVKRHADVLPLGPSQGQVGLWRAAWPRAFEPAVQQGAGLAALSPPLVWALMREESSFRPAVASPAGARGLMQLMPETAARVADQIGLPDYDVERLVEPAVNVRLGTAYLGGLLGRFDGRASAAIGSYNAGPAPVLRWLAERPGQADDEWVESIPYEETRNYVKRVLRSLHVYRELYADEGR